MNSRIAVLSKRKGDNGKAEEFFKKVVPFYENKGDFSYLSELSAEMGEKTMAINYDSLSEILK